jgi:RNA polymerase sigma-70 factor (ECF subfamily)
MTAYSTYTDLELIPLLKEGNQAAFAELYNRYKGKLYLHAYKMLEDDEEAKDVIQEMFSVIWARREQLNVTTTFENYLYGTVKNRILNFIAHQKVIDKYTQYLSNFVEEGVAGVDESMINKELVAIIEHEIARLPAKMKEIFEMSRYEGLSYKQIGDKLNISDKTVKKQLNNAAKILKPKIGLTVLFFLYM